MSKPRVYCRISLDDRMDLFRNLILLQDSGTPPRRAEIEMADRYDVTHSAVQAIIEEGINKTWPPLIR